MGFRWVSDGCFRWVSDGCQMGVRWMSDGCQMSVRWVSDGCQIGTLASFSVFPPRNERDAHRRYNPLIINPPTPPTEPLHRNTITAPDERSFLNRAWQVNTLSVIDDDIRVLSVTVTQTHENRYDAASSSHAADARISDPSMARVRHESYLISPH